MSTAYDQNGNVIACISDDGKSTCEYYGMFCKHPDGIINFDGAHPSGCPKLGKTFKREKDDRKYGAFRYGGLTHNYELTSDYFGRDSCYECGKDISKLKSYCRVTGKGGYQFKLLCGECAYNFNEGVIEKDGKVYRNSEEYNGEI